MRITSHWPGIIKYMTVLGLAWAIVSILLGLFFAFDLLEASEDPHLTMAIPMFLAVAIPTFLAGALLIVLPVVIWNWRHKSSRSSGR